ncbi:stage II sporulation protein GA (sporulation sigma-E factor processing peptidase) [Salirhabdus euzebyi]|uniref:Sporulation sigma-E factor-processing peptidase n=1 Tax=Salirhabdus euzebyi TaxID=394506 RepID=A0A841Q9D4_9BACI|nr:sigma-E processing peptidase SpoIIGA [Salirhabdus euzebyi]MBB6455038.1 stage II sporulation protein GA (sporulation sigma-E factor processing peptidase) [Salirhabdus euzebyi]
MTIYLDAVWILNFLIDWMILQLVHWLTRASTPRVRLIAGGIVASLLVPITLLYPNNFFSTLPGKIIFSLIILVVSFGFKNLRQYMKQFLSFYFVSFAIGGGLFGIYFLVGQQLHNSNGLFVTYTTGFGDMVSWTFVAIFFPIVWWFTRTRLDQITFEKIRYSEMCPVKFELDGNQYETTGFFDSGNSLMDPFTKKPVIVCDEVVLKRCFSDSDWLQLKKCQEDWSFEHLPDKWLSRIRMIPYQGVGGRRAFILIFKPDNFYVKYQNQNYCLDKVYIGIQFGELSADGSYHCLLHPKIMQAPKLKIS